ncbi:replication initiator [Sphaerisporangium dianthi]|uniref:Replication initiator n=1 Tax=Sphaerisporangium dianthi TaxID=1436120 RepID=A0ABV9CAU4_9ACTN
MAVVWGDQLDLRPILLSASLNGVSEQAVAGYIAKYATKGAEASGTIDHRVSCSACRGRGRLGPSSSCTRCQGTGLKPGLLLDLLPVTEHARCMIRTCWELGSRGEYAHLKLRPWAHMLGFRGHFATKSRRYSTTMGTLRQTRADHRAAEARVRNGLPTLGDGSTFVLGHWRFVGSGHSPGEAILAERIRQQVQSARAISSQRAAE